VKKRKTPQEHRESPEHKSHRIRLPGFLIEEETGLGDMVKRITYSMGIKPCRGCERRAAALNRWMRFSR
jgi:hypothetical protein